MRYLDDVGAYLARNGDDRAELTGPIRDVEPQLR